MDVLDQHARGPHFGGGASKSPYWPRFGGAFFCVGALARFPSSLGGQFVQHKSQARKGALADPEIRPTDDNTFRVSGARKIGIWLKNSFEQRGQGRLANHLSIGLQAAKDEVMSPRKSIQPAQQSLGLAMSRGVVADFALMETMPIVMAKRFLTR